ncbi:hypothetical protein VNO77_14434 [Canavalia gladiata]|uniref:Uncharacterized protein n=1 Tax=Canavalia gladiata TaxID=3824 RepID=A0AAN9M3H0_CANGL
MRIFNRLELADAVRFPGAYAIRPNSNSPLKPFPFLPKKGKDRIPCRITREAPSIVLPHLMYDQSIERDQRNTEEPGAVTREIKRERDERRTPM